MPESFQNVQSISHSNALVTAAYCGTSHSNQLLQGPDLKTQHSAALLLAILRNPCNYLNVKPEEYQRLVHLFGGTSSPYCASFALFARQPMIMPTILTIQSPI